MRLHLWGLLLVSALFLTVLPAQAQEKNPLTILRVTPTGEDVPASNQIVIEFNRPVVPIGRMERTAQEVGIDTTPPLNCQWRWLNTSSLSCNLDNADTMNLATRYSMKISPAIMAEDGAQIEAAQEFSFITQRPDINYTNFKTWRSPQTPVIRAVFTQPVSKSSAEAHIFMTAEGTDKRYALIASPDTEYQELPDYIYNAQEKSWVFIDAENRKSDDQATQIEGEEARRVWLLEPAELLPAETTITLKTEAGLLSAQGAEAGVSARDIVTFNTLSEFSFAGVSCSDNNDNQILIAPNEDNTGKLCNPMRPVSLAFTAPVLRSEVKKNAVFKPDLAGGRTDFNPWGEENRDWSQLGEVYTQGKLYYIGLPIGLKAAQTYTLSLPAAPQTSWTDAAKTMVGYEAPEAFEDEFGRTLAAPLEFTFATSHRNPNYEIVHHDAVLESGIDSEVPLYVNNLDSYTFDYKSVTARSEKDDAFTKKVNNISDIQYAIPLGVRDILGGKSGAIFGYLSTDPVAPNKYDGDSKLFAQVTPWQAHMKLGHFSSLLWVTDLATGQPVEGVTVKIYSGKFTELSLPKDSLATATTDAQGLAVLPGSETLDPQQLLWRSWEDNADRLFVRLEKKDDMALLPLSSNFELSLWSFSEDNLWSYNRKAFGHLKSWGMTAQGVYRAGDTMQYKIYLRGQNDKTLTPPPTGKYTLKIVDPVGKTVQENKGITFSEFGAYAGEFAIPETAAVGWYNFTLTADFSNEPEKKTEDAQDPEEEDYDNPKLKYTLYPLRVLVSDFTPSPFRVTTEIGGDRFHPDDVISIESKATLHSGGAYGDAAARATVTLRKGYFSSEHAAAKNFTFGTSKDGNEVEQIFQKSSTLNDKGEWIESYTLPQQPIYYGKLEVESAVQDDRGKSVASVASADYIGVDRFVGLQSPQWFYESKKPVTLQTLVVDEEGTPSKNTAVSVSIEFEDISVAKVKGAGNAYLNDITREWKQVATCENTSTDAAQDCTFTPEKAGTYRATASIMDTKNREHKTEITLWVSGDDYVQWNDQDNLALSIIPEKKEYKVGDTAKFLIKNPYPDAQALITIERYGVIDHIVQKLEGSAPVLEIPVKPDYLPGFYLSVVVTSPRVDQPPPEMGQIDMGKPAFRMGYITIPVRDAYKEMIVEAKPEQDVYRPRDTVKVNLNAKPRNAQTPAKPIEIAVAVLDESVFDLITGGRDAFDPYKGFYNLDPIDMRNYSLLYRLIGRQKFDKKGANAGGDGGDFSMRTLFKYVSYWNPSVKTDKDGNAQIEFEAPDNLTGWRVLAIATTPDDRMGLGEGTFKVNRPTEVRPVMPNQVHEDDEFVAGFSVMNRTDTPRTLDVTIEASGDASDKTPLTKSETVTLEPYKRTTVYLPLHAALLPIERDTEKGAITFKATAGDNADRDGMEFILPVLKKRMVDVAANYGTTTEDKAEEHIAFPNDIYTDTGDVSVVLSPSVIANLTGAFRYMRDYPYLCWEQILTRGVMAAHFKQLRAWIPDSFTWKDSETLPQSMLDKAANYQASNGGMTYFVATDARVDPYLSAYTAMAFTWLKKDGYSIPTDVEKKLHDYLLNFLRQDTAPDFYQSGMTSTVRAVALAALATEGKITADDISRYHPHLKEMSLFGKAHFMQAALHFDTAQTVVKEAADMIFAAGSESGGKFMFSETLDDGYLRLLATPLRDNCAILSAFMAYKKTQGGKDLIGDKPFKLVRMITQSRGSRDYWENTQENMFCMNALIDFSRVYENVKPEMKIDAKLDDASFGKTSFADFKDQPVTLTHPIAPDDEGKTKTLSIAREGDGRLYYAARLRYASKTGADENVNAGMDIHREYSTLQNSIWTLLKKDTPVKRGDTVRVDLYLSLPTARNFVVVDDPLPGGLETVNRDLATASGVDTSQATYDEAGGSMWFKFDDWREYNYSFWSFYHQELRHDSARFYADWLPAGNYHLSYMTQAIADGTFAAPPVRAEEMYDPDIYGRADNTTLVIKTDP